MDENLPDLFNEQKTLTPQQAKTLKEMERMANDRIRLYNPTEEDYVVRWAGGGFRVPNKNKDEGQGPGQAVQPRYIAVKYVREMADKILGGQRVNAIIAENERRIKSGAAKMNSWEDRQLFETPLREDNPERRSKIIPLLWMGIEELYGMDLLPEEAQPARDTRTTDEQLLANLEKPAKKLSPDQLPSLNLETPVSPSPAPVSQPVVEPVVPAANVPSAEAVLAGIEQ